MSNDKHYPTHPGAEHPPTMTCEIPLEEYESLKREIERLNRELEHVKNGDCINTCDVVEKHVKEEIKAKRALWMARAERARDNSILLPSKFMRNVWDNVERKCRTKAEEYYK